MNNTYQEMLETLVKETQNVLLYSGIVIRNNTKEFHEYIINNYPYSFFLIFLFVFLIISFFLCLSILLGYLFIFSYSLKVLAYNQNSIENYLIEIDKKQLELLNLIKILEKRNEQENDTLLYDILYSNDRSSKKISNLKNVFLYKE